ncbi:unnamed protein product [Angiostrongylus costaricensis]|uniref:Piwi domain-containing protein n=1 Tax=Angiostrongylus costaricensis TaxID=334426 RepID=A0A0R3PH89_ANGCS|nr:unnamed protein product [Angiostrongylus costaricensis]
MIHCGGTVLDAPVAIDKERNEVPMTPERAIKKKELNESPDGEVICAVVVMTAQEGIACVSPEQSKKVVFLFSKDRAIVQQFFEDLVDKCRERGLQVASEPLRVYHNIAIDDFEKCIKGVTTHFSKLQPDDGDRNMEKILLVIVINDRTYFGNKYASGLSSYGFIKSICDNNYGIASQVVDASTVIKATSAPTKYDD